MTGSRAKKPMASHIEGNGERFSLLVLGACFFLGMLSGLIFATLGEVSPELSAYLEQYFQMVGSGNEWRPAIWTVLWDLIRWPAVALVFGFTALGVFCVPALLIVRGFLLSYSISLFLRIFGGQGMLAALAAFGVTAFLAVPVLFAVSCDAFRSSLERIGKRSDIAVVSLHRKLVLLVPSAGFMVAAAILQWMVMPMLFSSICAQFFVS